MPQVSDPPASPPRKRGRPPRAIETGALIEAIERLFAEGGIDAVTIERTAAELGVSRATLYRTVPSKAHLLGIHFVKMTQELDRSAREATSAPGATPRERLVGLMRVQIEAAVQMRDYFFVYFDGTQLPEGVYQDWRRWADDHERVWIETVGDAIRSGDLSPGDPLLTTRLILGMTIWIANWFRTREGFTPAEIQNRSLELLGLFARTGGAEPRSRKPGSPRARDRT
ncbi:MAG: TetR/AcrR family transcriptional regulator [Actinobacteria bacterium]|nr:TetR/AcrR family transcriptional regulator [Actinomycetota bacterium]